MWVEVDTAKLQVALESIKTGRVAIQVGELNGVPVIGVLPIGDKGAEVHILVGKEYQEK